MNLPTNDGATGAADYDDFISSGDVEIGGDAGAELVEEKPKAPKPAKTAKEPVSNPDDDESDQSGNVNDKGDGAGDDDENQGDEGEGKEKPAKTPRDHQIERLKREKADLARQLREASNSDLSRRLEMLEKGLQGGTAGAKSVESAPAPDPSDTEKYPLGHLDDRYIEDKLEWLADKKAAEKADAVLQRQQENDQRASVERQQAALIEKVDELSTRGSEIYEDFQESVVEAGMRGDWDLTQTTFEAASEAENGVQILYELANNPAEATKVARMSLFQQVQYVAKRDAEIGQGKQPRRIPKAGEPPANSARGANSRTQINPATDNLDDFGKLWDKT